MDACWRLLRWRGWDLCCSQSLVQHTALKVTMGQKSQEILKKIQAFLVTRRIHSDIYRPKTGISALEIGRVEDLTRFLSSVPSIIKRKQVDCALRYLKGEISGNALIKVFDEEHTKLGEVHADEGAWNEVPFDQARSSCTIK